MQEHFTISVSNTNPLTGEDVLAVYTFGLTEQYREIAYNPDTIQRLDSPAGWVHGSAFRCAGQCGNDPRFQARWDLFD